MAVAAVDAEPAGLVVLPPYLVEASGPGLADYIRAIATASGLPVIFYGRNNAYYDAATVATLAADPQVIGLKDRFGDPDILGEIIKAVRAAGRDEGSFQFVNGLPTAETSARAYRQLGTTRYSAAAFCFVPKVANALYDALHNDEAEIEAALMSGFYRSLLRSAPLSLGARSLW